MDRGVLLLGSPMHRHCANTPLWPLLIALAICAAGLAYPSSASARTVTDMLGRPVTVPDRPLRLVSLAPSITETVFALGREAWLVGVTAFCDYPVAARSLPKVGGMATPNLEEIMARQPDLVLTTAEGNSREFLGQMDRLGISTFAVRPDGSETMLQSITALGRVLDAEPAASGIATGIRTRMRDIGERVAGRQRPGVLYLIWTDPLIGAGPGSYLNDLIALAGGRSVVTGRTVPYPRVNWEQIVGWAPEVILLARHDDGRSPAGSSLPPGWEAWQAIPAIRNRRVVSIPDDTVLRPGPRVGNGLLRLAQAIHPGAFATGEGEAK
jgi:iron complex transport system substrate-binding protein